MFKNNHRQVTVLLYRLKRNFGRPITVRDWISSLPDVTTGKQVQVYASYPIRRAIVMPYNRARDFIYDLTFVAANKNFTYGAFFDRTISAIIIDKKDLPIQLAQEDDIIIDTKRYQLMSIEETEGNTAYLIKAKALAAGDSI